MSLASRGSQERRQAMVEYLNQMSVVVAGSSEEEAEAALGAIIQEIKGKETLVATDQKLSKVLEKLVSPTSPRGFVVTPIFRQLNTVVLDLIYDQYGSHVFESIMTSLALVPMSQELAGILLKFTESIASDISGVLCDARATFVLRSAALAFSGFSKPLGDDIVDSIGKMDRRVEISPIFSQCFSLLLDALLSLDSTEFVTVAANVHSCVTLQLILAVSGESDFSICENLIKNILKTDKVLNQSFINESLNDRVKSKLMEGIVVILNSHNSEKLSKQIVNEIILQDDIFDIKYMFGFLQAFVSSLKSEELFVLLTNSLLTADRIKECVQKGKGNGIALIQRFAEQCVQFVESQKGFVLSITGALGIDSKSAATVWQTLLSLNINSFDGLESVSLEESITPQGCLLVSTLMGFKQNPIQILISNTGALVDHLKEAKVSTSKFFTQVGPGRTLQTVMSAKCALPTGIKKKVIRAVVLGRSTEELTQLVTDRKVGSWMITTVWDSCTGDVSLKQQLAEELLKIDGLREINWKVWKHCELASFTRRNVEWTATENRKAKVQNVFRDIIGPSDAKKPRT